MKRNIYRINDQFVNADNSTDAIREVRRPNERIMVSVEKICNTLEIIPTVEQKGMKLFEIFGNEYENSEFNSLFITATVETDAFTKYKENKPKATRMHAKLICKLDEIIIVKND